MTSATSNPQQATVTLAPSQAYTTITPTGPGSGDIAASMNALPGVNFSGSASGDSLSQFTVAGWIRFTKAPVFDTIFWAEGQFGIRVESDGLIRVWFGSRGGVAPVVTSTSGISDREWHYLAASCQQLSANQPDCAIVMTVDGIPVAKSTVAVSAGLTGSGHYIMGSGAGLIEFVSWSIWSAALPVETMQTPEFGPPPAASPDITNLQAAFSFASGPATDMSGHNVSIRANQGPTYWPRLLLKTGSRLIPAPEDNVSFFGSVGSIMGWVQLPAPLDPLVVADVGGNLVSIENCDPATFVLKLNNAALIFPGTVGSYVHLACVVTENDGNNGRTIINGWINGQPISNGIGSGLGILFPQGVVCLLNNTGAGSLYAQGLSVWDVAVTPQMILADMTGQDPTGSDGLLAYYALQHDLRNSVTGKLASTLQARIVDVIDGQYAAVAAEAAQVDVRLGMDCVKEPTLRFPRISDYPALAASHGVDLTAVDLAAVLPPVHERTLAWIEAELPSGDPALLAIKNDLLRNLRVGERLYEAGVRTGTISLAVDGGQTVFTYHDFDRPIEFLRVDSILDPMGEWIITIISDVIAVAGAAFGLLTTPSKLADVIRVILVALPVMKNALLDALEQGKVSAAAAFVSVIKEIYSAGLLLTVIKGLVTGSWWSLVFTALSLLGQILLCIFSGGAAVAIKLTLATVAVIRLMHDLSTYPSLVEPE